MKQIKTLMAGILLGSAALMACNRAGYNVVPDSPASASTQAKFVDDNSAMDNSAMFTEGNLNAQHISVRSSGSMLAEFNDPRSLNLFELLANAGLPLQPGKYAAMETTIDIGPADGRPALLLSGTISPVDEAGNTGEAVPLNFMINTPLRLLARSGVMILTENSNLLNLLNINPDQLTAGISGDMWLRAIDPATGSIVISDQRNPELYLAVLRNLGSMLQLLPLDHSTPPATTLDAVKLSPIQR